MKVLRWCARRYAGAMARIASVINQIGLFFQAVSATGIGAGALKYYGLQEWTPVFLVGMFAGLGLYVWVYSEYVWNDMNKERQFLSNDFSDPDKLINFLIQSRQHAMMVRELQREEPRDYDDILADMQAELSEEWEQHLDGVAIEANGSDR